MKKQTLILILLAIGTFSYFVTISIFFLKGHFNISNDIDYDNLSSLGSFISGVIGTIFNLIAIYLVWLTYTSQVQEANATKELVRKQIELSTKPDVFVATAMLFGYSRKGINQGYYPIIIHEKKLSTSAEFTNIEGFQRVVVKLINIGVAPAKYISYQWKFDLNMMVDFYNNFASDPNIVVELHSNLKSCKVGLVGVDEPIYFNNNIVWNEDFLTNESNQNSEIRILVPALYLRLYFLTLHRIIVLDSINTMAKEFMINDYPPLSLSVDYYDLADIKHCKIFEFRFDGSGYSHACTEYDEMFQMTISGKEVIPNSNRVT